MKRGGGILKHVCWLPIGKGQAAYTLCDCLAPCHGACLTAMMPATQLNLSMQCMASMTTTRCTGSRQKYCRNGGLVADKQSTVFMAQFLLEHTDTVELPANQSPNNVHPAHCTAAVTALCRVQCRQIALQLGEGVRSLGLSVDITCCISMCTTR